jgi:DNA-directed RNA polymerase subunit E'/Rpb7
MERATDNNIFMRMQLTEKVKLEPAFISKQYKDEVLKRLKAKVEGLCSRHGFIKEGSVEISKICVGKVEMIGLNGNTQFDVHFFADVCNPLLGSIIKCRVSNINKFGILAEAESIIEAIIAKNSVNIQSDIDLEKVRIGDDVSIEVIGKKYELNEKKISLIGKIVKDASSRKVSALTPSSALSKTIHIENEDDEEEPEEIPSGDESEDEGKESADEDDDDVEVDSETGSILDSDDDVKADAVGGNFFSDDDEYFNSDFEGGDDDNDGSDDESSDDED